MSPIVWMSIIAALGWALAIYALVTRGKARSALEAANNKYSNAMLELRAYIKDRLDETVADQYLPHGTRMKWVPSGHLHGMRTTFTYAEESGGAPPKTDSSHGMLVMDWSAKPLITLSFGDGPSDVAFHDKPALEYLPFALKMIRVKIVARGDELRAKGRQ